MPYQPSSQTPYVSGVSPFDVAAERKLLQDMVDELRKQPGGMTSANLGAAIRAQSEKNVMTILAHLHTTDVTEAMQAVHPRKQKGK